MPTISRNGCTDPVLAFPMKVIDRAWLSVYLVAAQLELIRPGLRLWRLTRQICALPGTAQIWALATGSRCARDQLNP